ncbi:MAG: CHAT domain-containing protein, partial [Acidobacteria bacterium]|nr:CHAT domain-containing protein [Acidobacteriota bacterium]
MTENFDLIITADTPNKCAELELRDAHGARFTYQAEFKDIAASHQHGLFDLRNYLRTYAHDETDEAARVAEIGVCIAEQVLGAEIFKHLYASESQRTLRIQLSGATEEANLLAAALARVPWEIARPSAYQATLGERNLLVRVVHEMNEPATQPLSLAPDETLRVLFVFAEARGSRPLALRKERQVLQQLFAKEIYPNRKVEAHFLAHGVTRARLIEQIKAHDGYHIVHWSGHGHLNLLELAQPGGQADLLSGAELLTLFKQAGGFIPRLFFLSACHSGDILRISDWQDFLAAAQGKTPNTATTKESGSTKEIKLDEQPGYTGTAHALLQGGVPSVVAMRYAVGDEYARELAVEFFRALLAHKSPKATAAALTMARNALLTAPDQSHYAACDHATPVLYGADQPACLGLKMLPAGRSPALTTQPRRLHQIHELTSAAHTHFVGRTWQLAELGTAFFDADTNPVAVITGLGGMGKTALVAESLALWEQRFDWVLLYQAKPNALSFENTLRDIDIKLRGELGRYHEHIKARPADAIYRDATAEFTGAARYERLTRNLIRALQDEAILLVLDNFETNLKPLAETPRDVGQVTNLPYGFETNLKPLPETPRDVGQVSNLPYIPDEPRWACQDAEWDRCLTQLATELSGSRSRVLVTCRRPLAALAESVSVRLGPLPSGEAALYLREHAGLSRMTFHQDATERALALRLLNASRFYPLLMDRLARLATGSAALRQPLMQALDTLEARKDFAQLPALFAARPGDTQELAYLHDALETSLDQFIQDASPDARRLLWLIAVANEPIEFALLESVWNGEESPQTQQLRQIKQVLEMLPSMPQEIHAQVQEQLNQLPPEIFAMLNALPPEQQRTTDHGQLTTALRYLTAVGLVAAEEGEPLSCHEVVRERIRARMEAHPAERDGLSENDIRLGYADQLAAAFKALQHQNMTAALQTGSRALVYCVQASDYDRLGNFASQVVSSTSDPRLLAALIPHLQAAAASAPAGEPRWSCLCYLADALKNGGRPDASLPFYEQAEAQVRAAAEEPAADISSTWQGWAYVGWIAGNWAKALLMTGNLNASHQRWLESAEAYKKARSPAIEVIIRELEALRIEIMQGRVTEALPTVEARLTRIAAWWQQHRAGFIV